MNAKNKVKGKKRLYLLRHAKATPSGDDIDDMPRPLAERGREQMAMLTEALRDKPFAPALAWVSTAVRTAQTLDLLRPRLKNTRVEMRDDLYLASAASLMEALRELGPERDVLLIGHNPGLHELALALLAPESATDKPKLTRRLLHAFPTGALAEFKIDCRWSELIAGEGRLGRFVRPKDLEELD